jgi:O-antigen/teichoic acid export membrane protein
MSESASAPRSAIERQLNVGLMVLQVVSALIVLYGVFYVVASWDGDDRPRSEAFAVGFVLLFLPGLVVFFTAMSARRRLRDQVVSARLFSILAGAFALLAALPLLGTVFGIVGAAAGLFTLTAGFLLKKDLLR